MKLLSIAVLEVIKALGEAKQAFSGYDVTRTIRNEVNAGKYSIAGAGTTTTPTGQTVQEIKHEDVREFLVQLYNSGSTPLQRKFGIIPSAFLYYFPGTDLSAYQAVGVNTPVSVATPIGNGNVGPITASNAAIIDSDTQVKIRAYLSNRKAEGKIPTLKQVQSRLKGIRISLKDISDFVISEGHSVPPTNGVLKDTPILIA